MARNETARSLAHTAVMMSAMIVLANLAPRRPKLAAALALIALTADLSVANGRFILTVPQEMLDTEKTPKVLELIAEAEKEQPADGPFRIHRMAVWNPLSWTITSNPDRVQDLIRWERDTIQPKYGLLSGVEYTHTEGTAELYDIMFFFAPFQRRLKADAARMLNAEVGQEAVIFPRRGFDLWNSRYFVLPIANKDWTNEFRSYASFLPETEPIYPAPDRLAEMSEAEQKALFLEEDVQILRNRNAFPAPGSFTRFAPWTRSRGSTGATG